MVSVPSLAHVGPTTPKSIDLSLDSEMTDASFSRVVVPRDTVQGPERKQRVAMSLTAKTNPLNSASKGDAHNLTS